ncbi:hypothetical protein [Bradyrhizobium sp.]|uniref:hypothetical protein n=1 Tax=Bradyrhizobium sp. TaxID=376 RepID=UPI001EB63CCC|nr:hypothetical protein [Bradyrhizobium sp.]MBV8920148.1 hypothetical protein [Bradyrhizobium sp.]MBV9981105.1 hypothetical protein [Bradyrhizobium sp.]
MPIVKQPRELLVIGFLPFHLEERLLDLPRRIAPNRGGGVLFVCFSGEREAK